MKTRATSEHYLCMMGRCPYSQHKSYHNSHSRSTTPRSTSLTLTPIDLTSPINISNNHWSTPTHAASYCSPTVVELTFEYFECNFNDFRWQFIKIILAIGLRHDEHYNEMTRHTLQTWSSWLQVGSLTTQQGTLAMKVGTLAMKVGTLAPSSLLSVTLIMLSWSKVLEL